MSEIKSLLGSYNIATLKRFGQNFMLSEATRRRFVGLLFEVLRSSDTRIDSKGGGGADVGAEVWEIGPGIGSLTSLILEQGLAVRCFEIDKGFVSCLQAIFAREIANGQLKVVEGNALQTLFAQDISKAKNRPRAIMGNLPYNIASVILSRIITGGFACIPMVFTFQKEVVERICAAPRTPNYGSLSVLCQSAMKTQNCGIIKPNSFYPIPRIHSASIQLIPIASQILPENQRSQNPQSPNLHWNWSSQDFVKLEKLLAILFHSRRKTIANNIKQAYRTKQGSNAGNIQRSNLPEDSQDNQSTESSKTTDPSNTRQVQISQSAILSSLQFAGVSLSLRAEQVSVPQYRQILAYLSEHCMGDKLI